MRKKSKLKVHKLLCLFIGKVLEESQCSITHRSMKKDVLYKRKVIKYMLSEQDEYTKSKGETFDWSSVKEKLVPILPLIKNCNGNVNFIDEEGQTILHVLLTKYVHESSLTDHPFDVAEVVQKLLASGASVTHSNKNGDSPLHIAAHQGNKTLITMMLDKCTNVNVCNQYGDTPLHIIVNSLGDNQACIRIISTLLSMGADPNGKNKEGVAPVHFAAEHCLVEILRILKKHGADFNLRTDDGKTLLHLVCNDTWGWKDNSNDVKTINYLVGEGCDISATDNEGYSPLHYAAVSCSLKVVRRLIRLGADLHCRTKESQLTLLHAASRSGDVVAIEFFIKAGINVNVVAVDGMTPLHLAVLENSCEAVDCLIKHGADVHAREAMHDYTPVHMTAIGCEEKLKLLMDQQAEVNVSGKNGITPLHLASMMGNVEVVQALIKHGADVRCKDKCEWTPFHLASLIGQLAVVKILLDHGINVDCQNEVVGMTPLHLASMRGRISDLDIFGGIVQYIDHWQDEMVTSFCSLLRVEAGDVGPLKPTYQYDEVLKLLLRNGADVNAKDLRWRRPIHFAIRQPENDVVKTLLKSGADVEVRCRYGYSPMNYVWEHDDETKLMYLKLLLKFGADINEVTTVQKITNMDTDCYKDIWNEVYDHLLKLRAAGLPIANAYKPYINESKLAEHRCINEIELLKNYMIEEGNLTLYDFLHMKPKCRLKFVEKAMLFKMESNFPEYHGIIRASYHEALDAFECEQLFESALIAFRRITNVQWPHICAERIFFYLDSWYLEMFIGIANVEE